MPPDAEPAGPGVARGAVTTLLARMRRGEGAAADELFPLVYSDLRVAAERLLRREHPGHTLQPTDLVHEGYLKLAGDEHVNADNRRHFLAIAARAMRQVLVDHARKLGAAKRGSGAQRVRITNADAGLDVDFAELLALEDALERLGALNARLPRVVELRYFTGLSEQEAAEVLGVTARTVQRDWATARAWLYKELYTSGH
jgi:RNA polymerase sigma-70 factor, ECF subfamily